jgi:hypothetical protein
MAFTREENVTITGFEDISISLFVPGESNLEDPQSGEIEVQLLLSDSRIRIKNFDLLARLGDDAPGLVHLANLVSLRDYIIARIESEVLPLP